MQRITTSSEKQTFNLGKKLAKTLKGGEVLALTGNLGAGKTVLIKGIAAGLGIKKIITSPTFVLMKVYPLKAKSYKLTANKMIHIDCYRTTSPQEIADIGATEYFGRPDSIVVVEWAEKIKEILPALTSRRRGEPAGHIKKITIKLKDKNSREIMIK
jgi:tRNA threonylcarbamoyladenosine biosynthesis protein TsaE